MLLRSLLLGVLALPFIACSESDDGPAAMAVCDELSKALSDLHEAGGGDREAAGESLRSAASEADKIQEEDLRASVLVVVDRYTVVIGDGITGALPEPERSELVSATQAVESAREEAGRTVDLSRPFTSD